MLPNEFVEVHMIYVSDINECSSASCVHGGGCVDDVNGYTCDCLDDYTGSQCQQRKHAYTLVLKHCTRNVGEQVATVFGVT